MPLQEGQWQIRDLVMGPGTPYRLMDDTSPFALTVRADQGGARAWEHGSWSGAEWANERVVPLRILVDAEPEPGQSELAAWLAAHQALAGAFAPVGDSAEQVELRFEFAGSEYVLIGRPRMVEPDLSLAATGRGFTRCAFVAQDPRIYAGDLGEETLPLPTQTGGLTVPLTVPLVISGQLSGGRTDVLNAGTTATALTARIDGPVAQPRITVRQPSGDVQSVRVDLSLDAGQWLEIDTAARTVLLNGLPQSNQRGRSVWDIDPYPLLPGASEVRFSGGRFNPTGQATITWRSAWW